MVIVTNLTVSVLLDKAHSRLAPWASFFAALILLGAGQLLGVPPEAELPAKIMENFGFGGQSATLVLTERGGRLLCQQLIPIEFEERKVQEIGAADSGQATSPASEEATPGDADMAAGGKPPKEEILARTADMKILSRLGSEYLLRSSDGTTIALPRQEVVSWSWSSGTPVEIHDNCERQGASGSRKDASFPIEQQGG